MTKKLGIPRYLTALLALVAVVSLFPNDSVGFNESTNTNQFPSPGDAMYRRLFWGDCFAGHAAIFYRYSPDHGEREIIQACGSGDTSAVVSWGKFLSNETYWGAYCQERVLDLYARQELILIAKKCVGANYPTSIANPGKAYKLFSDDDDMTNDTLRCDGLVEYCYEKVFEENSPPDDSHNIGIVPGDHVTPSMPSPIYWYPHRISFFPKSQLTWLNDESEAQDEYDGPGDRKGMNSYNSTPILSDGSAYPSVGDTSTRFYFTVEYADSELDVPCDGGNFFIDGGSYRMTSQDANYPYNCIYRCPATGGIPLSVGEHHYYFHFMDWRGDAVRDPSFGYYTVTVTEGMDGEPPVVEITNPSDGGTVSGITDITVNASDNVTVDRIEFYIEGILKHTDTNSPYSYSWNTDDYNDGQSYLIVAKAFDGAGNHSSDNANVTVNNSGINHPPWIILWSPDGDTANNSSQISWTAQDVDDNATIDLYRDSNNSGYNGTLIVSGLKEEGANYYSWNTSSLPDESSWYVYAITYDESDTGKAYSPGFVFIDHPTTVDNFEVDHTVLLDNNADGDKDGVLESGETATYKIYLENASGQTWYIVHADLSTSNPDVTILNSRVCYSTMNPGDISYGDGNFKFDTPSDFTGNISFTLTIGYKNASGSPYQDIENLNVYVSSPGSSSPAFSVETITYNDSDGNNDGMLQSGEESIDFFVKLKNTGSATAINVRGTIHDVSEIDFSDRMENYPDIAPGESSNPNGDFDIRSIPRSYSGTLNMTMTVEYGPSHSQSQDVPFTMTVYPAPYMYVHPKTWDFGLVSPGTPVTKTVQIDNYGNTDLQVYSIEPDSSDTDITGVSLPLTIGAGTSQSFNIEINTTGLNAFITRVVTVNSNAHLDSIQTVTITGTVTNPPSGEYHVIWSKDIPHQEQLGSWISNIGVGDTDGDGKREIIVTTYGQFYDGDADSARVYVYERIADDNYDTVWCSSEISLLAEGTVETHGLAIGDVTGDGKDDIVVVADQRCDNAGLPPPICYGEDRVYVLESAADNTWSNTWTGMTEIGAIKSLTIGDSDSDGNKEIIVTDSNKKIYVYERSGGSFSKTWESSPLEYQSDPGEVVNDVMSVIVDDSDSDGHKEIIIATDYGQFYVFENTGNNSYSQSFAYQDCDNGWDVAHIAVDDVDQDGNREIILVTDISPQLRIYECNGDNSYNTTSPPQYAIGDEGYCVTTGDTDDDGNKEIIVGTMDWKGSVQILENFSDNSYVEVWRDSAGEIDTDMYTIALDNTNSDNYIEIITGADSKISVVGFSTSPDLQIVAQNISFNKTTPTDADSIQITATVQNIGSGDASGITVRFYNGNPDSGGTQIGTDETIASLISGNSESVHKTWTPVTDDTFQIYVEIDPDSGIAESDETNNLASKDIVVTDNDLDPPSISNVLVQEYSGDSDGLIEDNEQVKISWVLSDPSGICTSSCKIDTITYEASSQDSLYYVIQGPFSAGTDSFTISATDNDNSKETSTYSGTFDVELHAPSVVSVSPVDSDTTVSVNATIEVTFNEAMQESTINTNTFYLKDSLDSVIAGTLAYYIADKKAVFTPDSRLDNRAYYTATVVSGDTGVKDHNNNNMDIDYVWSFRTIPDTTNPTVAISAPADSSNLKGSISIFGTVLDDNFDRYVVEYKGLSDWDTIGVVHTESVLDSMLETWNTTLVTDGNYMVRLTARDIFDNISSDSIIVFVDNSAPNIPSLITPADSSVVSDTTPTFLWHSVSGSDISYILEYATDSMFAANLVQVSSISETTYTVPDIAALDHNRYYWHTMAIDGASNPSGYQIDPYAFAIDIGPTVSGLPDTSFAEDSSITISLDNYVVDPDDPEADMAWGYIVLELKKGNKGSKDGPLYVSIDQNRIATINCDPNWNGTRDVVFIATDPMGLSDSDTMRITVEPANDPPHILYHIPDTSFDEDTLCELADLITIFADVDDSVLTYSWAGNDSIQVDTSGTVVTLMSNTNWYGSEQIIFTATDDSLASISDTVVVTVNAVNARLELVAFLQGYYEADSQSTKSTSVELELRDKDSPQSVIQEYSTPLDSTGCSGEFKLTGLTFDTCYVVVRKINHLAVISSTPYIFDIGNITDVNLTVEGAAQGIEPMWLADSVDSVYSLRGGDIIQDGVIFIPDYCKMAQNWATNDSFGDIDGDSVVFLTDFNILAQNWARESFLPEYFGEKCVSKHILSLPVEKEFAGIKSIKPHRIGINKEVNIAIKPFLVKPPAGLFYLRPYPDSTDFEYDSGDTLTLDVVVSVSDTVYPFYSYSVGNFLSYDTTIFSLVSYENYITDGELSQNWSDMIDDGKIQYSRMKNMSGGTDTGWVVVDSLGQAVYRLLFEVKEDLQEDTTQMVFSNVTIADSNWNGISTTAMDTTFYIIEYGTEEPSEAIPVPRKFELSQTFPNPAFGRMTIKYAIPKPTHTTLKIYDISGKLVRTLVDESGKPAYYSVSWDGKDNKGKKLASGIYFIRFKAGDYKETKKLILMR